MSNSQEILEWFNYESIINNSGAPLNLTETKYQKELDSDIQALIPEVLKGDQMAMFKLGEMLSYRSNDASLWFQSEKHREYKYNAWILMGLSFKQLYPSYQKEVLATHYPSRIADLINIDGIANIDIFFEMTKHLLKFFAVSVEMSNFAPDFYI